jgi:cytochrome c oxidase subunit 3
MSFVATVDVGAVESGRHAHPQAVSIALWAFIGVATALFSLFLLAYVMRMASSDWSPIGLPWQLLVSTALLVAGSATMEAAGRAAHAGRGDLAHSLLQVGGACALSFVCVQLWAWHALAAARVMMAGNPAASFFYVLTAMHGLHVLGGLVGWTVAMRRPAAWRMALCARYWHFLLVVWAALFAAMAWLTPEFARWICGQGGTP